MLAHCVQLQMKSKSGDWIDLDPFNAVQPRPEASTAPIPDGTPLEGVALVSYGSMHETPVSSWNHSLLQEINGRRIEKKFKVPVQNVKEGCLEFKAVCTLNGGLQLVSNVVCVNVSLSEYKMFI